MANVTVAQAAINLERSINIVKYTIFCVNVIIFILGAVLFGVTIAARLDSILQVWLDWLDIGTFYTGIYILIFTAILVILVPIFSCLAVYQEITQLLLLNAGGHALCFFLLFIGSAVTLENSVVNSGIQTTIHESLRQMILNSYDPRVSERLNMIQEGVGCCGADGANDYIDLRKPLPTECRDTVTGNAYFHGCTDEVTWFLEDKAVWISGISFVLAALHRKQVDCYTK